MVCELLAKTLQLWPLSLVTTLQLSIAYDPFLIADCFPLLKELDLRDPKEINNYHRRSLLDGVEAISLSLSKLLKVTFSRHHYINDQSLLQLINNGKLLEEVSLFLS